MNKVIEDGTLRLLITESTCDVILSCRAHRLMAHKLVLSIASPVLRELLRKQSSEATTVLILPDVNSSTMSTILDYIYTGTTVVYSHALDEFLSVAKFLQIVVDTQNIENMLETLDCVKKVDESDLVDYSCKKASGDPPIKSQNENIKVDNNESESLLSCEEKYSTKPQKRLPDLLPIDVGTFRKNIQRKMCNVIVPSPWCPRDTRSFLRDPRSESLKSLIDNEMHNSYLEDTNNNFQLANNKEAMKHTPKKLDSIIRHLYLNNPEVRKEQSRGSIVDEVIAEKYPSSAVKATDKPELPKFTNFPFSRHLTDLVPVKKRVYNSKFCRPHQKSLDIPPINTFTQASPAPLAPDPLIYPHSPLSSKILPLCSETVPNFNNDSSNSVHGITNENSNDNSMSSDSSNNEKKEERESVRKKMFKCEDCGKSFSQLRNYKYHRSIHEGTKEFSAKCHECGKTFNDKGYLSSHMKIHRDRKEYACPSCPKRFNQRVAYNMHLRIHTGVKPHECPTCGKSFSRKMLLKQHQRVHTGERPYSCPECGKTFADRSNMSLHARLHTGVKPYACTVCPKSFTKKHHLKTHMNFHTGLKPYTCENCGLAFSQSSNMRTHYKKCILKDNLGRAPKAESSADNNSS